MHAIDKLELAFLECTVFWLISCWMFRLFQRVTVQHSSCDVVCSKINLINTYNTICVHITHHHITLRRQQQTSKCLCYWEIALKYYFILHNYIKLLQFLMPLSYVLFYSHISTSWLDQNLPVLTDATSTQTIAKAETESSLFCLLLFNCLVVLAHGDEIDLVDGKSSLSFCLFDQRLEHVMLCWRSVFKMAEVYLIVFLHLIANNWSYPYVSGKYIISYFRL